LRQKQQASRQAKDRRQGLVLDFLVDRYRQQAGSYKGVSHYISAL
jgi:hypothetical protein